MSNIVLVGGSFLGAWCWERVTPTLVAEGHNVHELTLTGFGDRVHLATPDTNLTTHATDIVNAIEFADLRDVVLVAHSYTAAPATIAAARIPDRLARLVYVAGVLPVPGKSLFEITPPEVEKIIQGFVDTEGDGWLIPVWNDYVLDNFYGVHGLSTVEREWLLARCVPQPVATYRESAPDDLSAVEAVRRTYVFCTGDGGDLPVKPGTPGYDVVTLEAGHWPMATRPAELASILLQQAFEHLD